MDGKLQQMDVKTAMLIASGQVITEMAVAVKEVLENALDAGAHSIGLRFVERGVVSIEVTDDGGGIRSEAFEVLGGRGCTSKLRSFDQLTDVDTFGFRGEAINSLCNIAEVTIHSRHLDDEIGTLVKFDGQGKVVEREKCPRVVGTTITLKKLFRSLPVRRKELITNARRAFDRTLTLVQQFSLGSEGVKFFATNQETSSTPAKTIFACEGRSLASNLVELFDHRQFDRLMPLVVARNIELEDKNITPIEFELDGYISKPDTGCGRASADRQFFYINGRPVNLKSIAKGMNRLYRTFNRYQYPFLVVRIKLEERMIDRNLTPDKRYVLMGDNHYIAKVIEHSLIEIFKPQEMSVIGSFDGSQRSKLMEDFVISSGMKRSVSGVSLGVIDGEEDISGCKIFKRSHSPADESFAHLDRLPDLSSDEHETSTIDSDFDGPGPAGDDRREKIKSKISQTKTFMHPFFGRMGGSPGKSSSDKENSPKQKKNTNNDSPSLSTFLEGEVKFFDKITHAKGSFLNVTTEKVDVTSNEKFAHDNRSSTPAKVVKCNVSQLETSEITPIQSPISSATVPTDSGDNRSISSDDQLPPVKMALPSFETAFKAFYDVSHGHDKREPVVDDKTKCIEDEEEDEDDESEEGDDEVYIDAREAIEVDVTMEAINNQFAQLLWTEEQEADDVGEINCCRFSAKIEPEDNEAAEHQLKINFDKSNFALLEVVGQFNSGFIIGRQEADLFIIDQHALDERVNFERLLTRPELSIQTCIVPLKLPLDVASELIVLGYLSTFERLGFRLRVDEDASPGERISATSVPCMRNWVGGRDDIDEIVAAIRSSPTGEILDPTGNCFIPSQMLREIGYQACRTAIMFGDHLTRPMMERLLANGVKLKDPWHCAHNRPTIRHLGNLVQIEEETRKKENLRDGGFNNAELEIESENSLL